MLSQMLRYLKGDRIIKSNSENLQKNTANIANIRYPFILKQTNTEDDFLVCGTNSCFANTKDATKLEEIIIKSVL